MPDLNHLHLHVRDTAQSGRFYEQWFGLREHVRHGDILFLRDGATFDLALAPDPAPPPLPSWFHFGFRLGRAEDVRDLHRRMASASLPGLCDLYADDDMVSFRVRDPDGYGIEVYWE